MRGLLAFITMQRKPVTLLDVAWAFVAPLGTACGILALIIWATS